MPWLSSTEFFKSLLLSFSPNLDEFNPDIPEWRQDVGRVIKKALLQVSDFHFLLSFPYSPYHLQQLLCLSLYLLLLLLCCCFSIISYTPITSAPPQHPGLIGAAKRSPSGQTSNFSSDRCWNVSAFFSPSWIPYLWSVLSVNNIITSELRSCPLKWNLKQLRHCLYHINVLECKTAAGALSEHEAQLLKSAIYLSIVVLFVLPVVCVL